MKTNVNTWIIGIACLVVVLVLVVSMRGIFTNGITNSYGTSTIDAKAGNIAKEPSVQNAKLSLVNFEYTLEPRTLKKGIPARIVVDANTLSGCMKNVVIADFGVRKYITATDNIIEFTPDKTGTFVIACSMGMGPGTFSVTDDGSAPTGADAQVRSGPSSNSGGSCDKSGGGCGCMG